MKQTSANSVHAFLNLGLSAKIMADKKFPDECPERALLLEIEQAFIVLWEFQHSLTQTRDCVELIRSITTPDEGEVIDLALYLKDIADSMDANKEATKAIKRASGVMQVWYRLYSVLDRLLADNEAMNLGLNSPEGRA